LINKVLFSFLYSFQLCKGGTIILESTAGLPNDLCHMHIGKWFSTTIQLPQSNLADAYPDNR